MVTPEAPDRVDPRWRPTPMKIAAGVVLLIGIVVPLLVPTYDRIDPRLFGFPFFYWYQLIWVFLAAAVCWIAFLLLKTDHDRHRRQHHGRDTGAGR